MEADALLDEKAVRKRSLSRRRPVLRGTYRSSQSHPSRNSSYEARCTRCCAHRPRNVPLAMDHQAQHVGIYKVLVCQPSNPYQILYAQATIVAQLNAL